MCARDGAPNGDPTIDLTTGIGARPTAAIGSGSGDRDATAQAAADPLRPPTRDGWTPDRIVVTHSKLTGGFAGSALKFALGGVDEEPGQRLSTAQVDTLAPFYAQQFELDEGFVRQELAKVYIYLGGPVPAGNAMTIGHHIFVPDQQSLEHIVSPKGKSWLAHELAHTMQYLAYENGNPHHFLSDYVTGLFVGIDPKTPARGTGAPVWGSIITGLNLAGQSEDHIGDPQLTPLARAVSGVLPAAALGSLVGAAGGGLLTAARATTATPLLGRTPGALLGLQVLAAPAVVGAAFGTFADRVPEPVTQAAGTLAGAGIAFAALSRSGAFSRATIEGLAHTTLGRGAVVAAGIGAVAVGAVAGWLGATATGNTVNGASRNAAILQELSRSHTDAKRDLTYAESLHDAHWQEIDAEAVARIWTFGEHDPIDTSQPVAGRTPDLTKSTVGDRLDWGLKVPLTIGIPAVIAAGSAVLLGRTGKTLFDASIREGRTPLAAVRAALQMLGGTRGGIVTSMAVGGSVTLAPLIVGGLVGPVARDVTGSDTAARVASAAAAGTIGGTLLTLALRGRGGSTPGRLAAIGAGALVSAGVGLLAGGIASDAIHPRQQRYATSA